MPLLFKKFTKWKQMLAIIYYNQSRFDKYIYIIIRISVVCLLF